MKDLSKELAEKVMKSSNLSNLNSSNIASSNLNRASLGSNVNEVEVEMAKKSDPSLSLNSSHERRKESGSIGEDSGRHKMFIEKHLLLKEKAQERKASNKLIEN